MNLTKKEKQILTEKTSLLNINPEQLPEEMQEALLNKFVDGYRKGHLVYSRLFYRSMHNHIEKGMTYVEAYKALGFNVEALGTDRANAAGKRAEQMARDGSLYKASPGDYDGTVPLKRMSKDMTPEEKAAYLEARCMYLECALEYEQEKKRSQYWAKYSELKKARENEENKNK